MPSPDKASELMHLVAIRTPVSPRSENSHDKDLGSAAIHLRNLIGSRFSLLHAFNLPLFAGALVTGVLLFSPTLRAALMSGYSESIRGTHRWLGRGQILLALGIVAAWMCVRGRGTGSDSIRWNWWRAGHVWVVAAAALGFALTGTVIASPSSYPLSLVDYSLTAHLYITYLSCALAAIHAAVTVRNSHQRVLVKISDDTGKSRATENSSDAV